MRRACCAIVNLPGGTLATGASAIFVLLTGLVASQVAVGAELVVLRGIQSASSEALDAFAALYTHGSSLEPMLLVALAGGVALFLAGWGWRSLAPFGFLLTVPVELAAKMLVAQPQVGSEFVRRSGNYIFFWLGTTYSYPSSHAARAAFLAIALWVVLVGIGPLRDRRWLATTLCVTLALTLGFTRVYLGYHWFSDVLGGWALGIASAGATAWLVGRRRRTSAGVLIAPTQPVDDRPTGHG